MKKFATFFAVIITTAVNAQIPAGYYNGTEGLTGSSLKTKLHDIISANVNDRGYGWTVYSTSDRDQYYEKDNTLLDIYSENPAPNTPGISNDPYNYTIPTNQCGSYSVEGNCYNREHTIPQSTFGSVSPMKSDYHHVLPTDGKVNGMRDNFPYGEVSSATWTSKNGSKLGSSSMSGYGGTVFEPIDEFKGDIARIYFYFVTRYQNKISTFNYVMWTNGNYKQISEPFLKTLIKWNEQDPVSQKEIDRNNAVYNYQNNRNPYVDHPEWVASIFGTSLATNDYSFSKNLTIAPNPVKSGAEITISGLDLKNLPEAWIYDLSGKRVQEISEPFKNGNKIRLNNLPKGLYILKTGDLNTKIIVE